MKITTITILFFLTSCFAIWLSVRNFKKEAMSFRSTVLWIVMWATIGISSIFPSIMDYFMELAQMKNRIFFILLSSVFILLILIFNLTSRLEKTQRDNTLLAQELTILRYKIDKSLKKNQKDQQDSSEDNSG